MRRPTAAWAQAIVVFLLPASTIFIPFTARAQGLSGSEVSGTVRLANGRPSQNAMVILTDRNTGAERTTRTRADGGYRFESVDVGSYRLEARAIGAKAAQAGSIELHLGDRLRIDIVLGQQATVLDEAVIRAGTLRDPGAGGPAETIAGRAAHNIPLLNRDFVGLLLLSSQAAGPQGLWITGQHSRYNGIQIDGAAANDFFGVSITPGSGVGGRLISQEAIEEVRIFVAPFDVRQSGFAGGLVTAATRSGSNKPTHSVFASLTRAELVGSDTSGAQFPEFNQLQYGLTAGGPIIRDRLHYFLAAEFQQRAATLIGLSASDPATGVSEATAQRMQNAIRDRYGFDPGDISSPDLKAPTGNVFLKLSWHPRSNVSLELSPMYASATHDTLSRSINGVDGWQLSRSGSQSFSTTRGSSLKANYSTGPVSNETIAGFTSNVFGVRSSIRAPVLFVQGDAANVYAAAGSVRGGQGTKTFQSVAQLSHNSSVTLGRHTIMAGTQDYVVQIRDNFVSAAWGVWTFASVDSLESGKASKYELAIPARPGEPLASYRALLVSSYLEDQWQTLPSLRVTAGVRADADLADRPRRNESLLANDALGNIDTRRFPSGNWVLSPRLGFAWTLDERGRRMLRGGFGFFTARPPFAWTTNVYSFTGETQTFLTCTAKEGVPRVSVDVANLPTSCTRDGGASSAVPSVAFYAPDFHSPQSVKTVLGFDSELGNGWKGSIDVISARTKNQAAFTDVNLRLASTNGEKRAMYGTLTAEGNARPARIAGDYGPIYRFGNYSADRSSSLSVNLRKEWSADRMVHVGYTWSRTMDVMGLTGFAGGVIMRNNPVDGTLESRELRRSARDVPHNFVATAIFPAGPGFTGGLFFRARSGTPWAFTVSGDANADGARGNDLAYIPRDSTDISLRNPASFPALDNLIEKLACARSQRGRIMKRNSCRNSAVAMLDGRVAKVFRSRDARRVEVSADVFNVPNLINHRWGIIRETSSREDVPLMTVTGWDDTHNRPRYSIPTPTNGVPILPSIDKAVVDASRWRVQLGARYEF